MAGLQSAITQSLRAASYFVHPSESQEASLNQPGMPGASGDIPQRPSQGTFSAPSFVQCNAAVMVDTPTRDGTLTETRWNTNVSSVGTDMPAQYLGAPAFTVESTTNLGQTINESRPSITNRAPAEPSPNKCHNDFTPPRTSF